MSEQAPSVKFRGPQDSDGQPQEDGAAKEPETTKPQLLHWKDMPEHLQFNPYIHTGYRPLSNPWGCVNSMWAWHNETINIVTHGK